MLVNGYAIQYRYTGDGTLEVQTRIPNIHGPMSQQEYEGQKVRNYTQEGSLPWYPSLLLPHTPNYGDVLVLYSEDTKSDFIVLGMTGGNYGNMFKE